MSIYGKPTIPSMDVALEKYVGNSRPEFKAIEQELKKIIAKIKRDYPTLEDRMQGGSMKGVALNAAALNRMPEVRNIERLFKKIFNLREVALHWVVSSKSNAYTYTKAYMFMKKNYKTDNIGHRTNDSLFVGINMYTGIVTYANLNEKEILAIMLHEIGHNFYNSILHTLANLPVMLSPVIYVNVMGRLLSVLDAKDVIDLPKFIHNGHARMQIKLSRTFPGLAKFYHTLTDFSFNLISVLSLDIAKLAFMLEKPYWIIGYNKFTIFTYSTEKHADSFAVDYGYGVELASALKKFRVQENTLPSITDVPGLNWISDLASLQLELISSVSSGYPHEQNRIRTGLDRLRASSKDLRMDVRTRAELDNQIAAYEDYYYNYYLKMNDENKRKGFRLAYMLAVEKMFNGKLDLRELLQVIDSHSHVGK